MVLVAYSALNVILKGRAWDPYPFILLNLFLSMLASIQAPVIMMSQNRQDTKDRLRSELDFDVNRRAESEIQALSHKLSLLTDKVSDVEDLIRATNPSRDKSIAPHRLTGATGSPILRCNSMERGSERSVSNQRRYSAIRQQVGATS